MKNKKTLQTLVLLTFLLVVSYGGYKVYFFYKYGLYLEFAQICLSQADDNQWPSDDVTDLDRLRHCLHENSIHKIDAEYYALAKQGSKAYARGVLAYFKDSDEVSPPHMECSKRTGFLYRTYKALGYEAESIVVVRNKDAFPDHVLLRVLNKKTKKYELQDPTFDIHYRLKETGERLDIYSLIKLSSEEVTPCKINGECGWQVKASDGSKVLSSKEYFGISFLDFNDETGPLIYNPEKFNPFKGKVNNGQVAISYCEKKPHQCKKIINVLNGDIN